MKHDTASYSNHPHRESANLINIFNIPNEDCLEVLISNKKSGNPTFLLHKEIASPEVTHELHDSKGFEDSDLKDSIDQTDLANLDDLFVDPTPEMFTDEQPPDYSFPPRFDVYPDDFLEIESDADNFDDDSFDSKGEKIKEDDDLPLPNNEDKVFNPGILIHEKSVSIITRVAQEKKLAISYASLVFEDFDPPFYKLLVFKEVPNSIRLLPFSFENEEKVFKPGIYTSEKGEKIKESKLLMDQLDLPCDIFLHSEYDSFASQDFFRDDDLPLPNNEDKVFNPGIPIHEKSVSIITRVAQEKKLAISYASLVFEDFDPPFYKLLVFKEVPNSIRLLPFSFENEEKVFKPGIYTSEK
nr:hypothetical protein [Tanacetum cinerariifolium]